jgi:D-glycero-D-manno-heptose 1,7-bisphosphate phosphatase
VRDVAGRGAAFLDRDGTINVKAPEGDYITAPEQVRLLPGAARAIRQLNDLGALVVVVTNQRGISLGRMTADDLHNVHERLSAMLAARAGARVDAFFFCPHDHGQCDCRKPHPGMLRDAVDHFPEIDLDASVLIGDAPSDVAAAERFGVRSLQLGHGTRDLADAVEHAVRTGMLVTAERMACGRA